MPDPDFRNAVTALMRDLGVEGLDADCRNDEDLYTVSIDDSCTVHLVGAQSGFIHLWSFPAKLPPEVDRETLLTLLAVNAITFDCPAMHLGLHPASGDLMLWTRQPLAELDARTMRGLLEQFMQRSSGLREWIGARASAASTGGSTGGVPDDFKMA